MGLSGRIRGYIEVSGAYQGSQEVYVGLNGVSGFQKVSGAFLKGFKGVPVSVSMVKSEDTKFQRILYRHAPRKWLQYCT